MEQIICSMNMFFEYFSFFYVIFRKRYREVDINMVTGIIVCLLVLSGGIVAKCDWRVATIGPISIFLIWIYIVLLILFEVSIIEIVALGIGQWLILSMLESAIHIMLQQLQLEKNILDNIIMLLITCNCWIFYILVGKRYDEQTFKIPLKIWWMLDAIMIVLTAMMSFFTYIIVQEFSDNRIMFVGRALLTFGEIVVCILLFVLLFFYNSAYNFRKQKEIAEIQNRQQREYFLQLLEREEETRRFRHDIINDLLEIQNYCTNKNCKRMKDYLEGTLGIVQKISKSSYDVGNDIANTVINYYLKPLKEKYSVEINGYMSEEIFIEERDLCVILANLIKNASEAVCKMDSGNIWVNIEQGKKYLCIRIKNTFDGRIEFDKKGIPITLKSDKMNHGIGMKSIVDVVKKNGGIHRVKVENGIYEIEVYLKI